MDSSSFFCHSVEKQTVLYISCSTVCLSPQSLWCINGQKAAENSLQTEQFPPLSTAESQSLRQTPGRLVKNILAMQTFIPFASYQRSLSQPKMLCCCLLCSHKAFAESRKWTAARSHCASSSPGENDST